MKPKTPQQVFDLYDEYCHGYMDRRSFMNKLTTYAVGGVTMAALLESVMPDYASAQEVAEDDNRIVSQRITYPSPKGAGTMGGLYVRPATVAGKLPGIVVIHENRGLNPYVEDVARRAALGGYQVLAPDALYPLGGYPGNDDDGRSMQRKRDPNKMFEDFVAAVRYLQSREDSTGKVGCVGFCYGGGVSNLLAARLPDLAAAVPFYGRVPPLDEVANIRAPLMIHYAGLDKRINDGWPGYEEALRQHGKNYVMYMYDGVNHGFHNYSTGRYDAKAAALAWDRTMGFFKEHLG
ncbi:dienelactone hydrolase family protein [Emcibacter nanhaiensis]|uniref:Dienelactone hydrolase family protein n=1 Tax=Emcibacter nanhaiensis TaxID=1505037 RepID=A0A501PEV2_9PROT|nr:dienelactone hydrolase family protein [Emcibacter nanhaiensis]TPD58943.1 dienelactone hydrolase family protein [Emcibacter nanhaiensis]